jgi:hypothetical protein
LLAIIALVCVTSNVTKAQKVNACGYKIHQKCCSQTNFKSVYEAADIVKGMLDTINWKEILE